MENLEISKPRRQFSTHFLRSLFSKPIGGIEFYFLIGVLQPSENSPLLFPRVGLNRIMVLLVVLKEMKTLANGVRYILECMGSISPPRFFG